MRFLGVIIYSIQLRLKRYYSRLKVTVFIFKFFNEFSSQSVLFELFKEDRFWILHSVTQMNIKSFSHFLTFFTAPLTNDANSNCSALLNFKVRNRSFSCCFFLGIFLSSLRLYFEDPLFSERAFIRLSKRFFTSSGSKNFESGSSFSTFSSLSE